MRPLTFFLAAPTLALCAVFFVPAAAFADPPHFLSDSFALPAIQKAAPAKKPVASLNDHLERMPKTYMVYGLRSSASGKLVCTDRLGHPTMSFPLPKAFLTINNSIRRK